MASNAFTTELRGAVDAARAAGAFIKKSLGRVRTIEYKGAINLVTDVDRRAEDIIIRCLRKTAPRYGVLAEEREPELSPHGVWIIDPLDGTTNFAHQFPFFAVSIALECDGQVRLGVVYDPLREELFSAVRGRPARLNSRRIRVSAENTLDKAFLATGFSYGVRENPDNGLAEFGRFILNSQAVRRAGAASLDLCYVACGRFDGFWEQDLKPWDTAAAALMIECSGGRVSGFQGQAWSCHDPATVASNGLIHPQMIRILQKCSR